MTKAALKRIKEEIHHMDPNVREDEPAFHAAVVMLSALHVGPESDALAAFTGYPRREVREYGRRLRECGIWKGGRTHCGWANKESGVVAFWLDVSVALGWIRRTEAA